MSVFTPVDRAELARWLEACGAGRLQSVEAVAGGVENSNYRVVTGRGAWVLTLFEWQPAADAARCLALVAHLAEQGLPVATPQPQPGGRWLGELSGKPAALSRWVEGAHPRRTGTVHCAAIGDFLARMHLAAADFPGPLPDTRGTEWRLRCREALDDHLDTATMQLMDQALTDADALPDLPSGVIHADLFRDNALFVGKRLAGVIDFYYACRYAYAYDIAVAAIDWCRRRGRIEHRLLDALCGAYATVRKPDPLETSQFPRLLSHAALRFWISREYDRHFPRPGPEVQRKNPDDMRRLLLRLRNDPVGWP